MTRAPPPVPRATKPVYVVKQDGVGQQKASEQNLMIDEPLNFAPALPARTTHKARIGNDSDTPDAPPLPQRPIPPNNRLLPPPQRSNSLPIIDEPIEQDISYILQQEPLWRCPPRITDPYTFPRESIVTMLECDDAVVTASLRLTIWTQEPMSIDFTDQDRIVCLAKSSYKGVFYAGSRDGWVYVMDVHMGIVQKRNVHRRAIGHIREVQGGLLVLSVQGTCASLKFDSPLALQDTEVSYETSFENHTDTICFVSLSNDTLWVVDTKTILVVSGTMGQSKRVQHSFGEVRYGVQFKNYVLLVHKSGIVSVWLDGRLNQQLQLSARGIVGIGATETEVWFALAHGKVAILDDQFNLFVVFQAQSGLVGLHVDTVRSYTWDSTGQIKTWDSRLEAARRHRPILEQEHRYCTYGSQKLLCVTFNCAARSPGGADAQRSMFAGLDQGPDLIHIGLQEVVDLEDKALTAKSLFFSASKMSNASYEATYAAWRSWFTRALNMVFAEDIYVLVSETQMIGLQTLVFVKQAIRPRITRLMSTLSRTGVGSMYGNKGAIITTFCLDDSSVCLINAHLAAGQNSLKERNSNLDVIHESQIVQPAGDSLAYVQGLPGFNILDHEFTFLTGDLNYRIDLRRETVLQRIKAQQYGALMRYDQLNRAKKSLTDGVCSEHLQRYTEAEITFPPSYKYDVGTDNYDTSTKLRTPAWCDRILFRSIHQGRLINTEYTDIPISTSDHRPVRALFTLRSRKIDRQQYQALQRAL